MVKTYIPVLILKKYVPARHTSAMIALKRIIQDPTPHFNSRSYGRKIINSKINKELFSSYNRAKARKAYKFIEVK